MLKTKLKNRIKYKALFKKLDISKGTKVVLHSNLAGVFQGEKYNEKKIKNFLYHLNSSIGRSGELIIPAYNYDFTRSKTFNYEKSESQVGGIANYIIKKKLNFFRSKNPVFSHLILKKKKNLHYPENSKICLGKESFFDQYVDKGFKIFGFCCSYNSITFLHHIEALQGVKYRFNKIFKSTVICKNKKKNFSINYFVGKKKIDYKLKNKKILKLLKLTKSFKTTNYGKFICWSVDSNDLLLETVKKIKKNYLFLIKD